jgi:tripartite-type tricarboxylate transporter receptor subunit TctC
MRRLALLLLVALALLPALAAAYPTRAVRILVPAQPGGGLDLVGRAVADQLGRVFGESFVVENSSGGGGAIAAMTTARAAPDGYTLMVGYVGTHGTNPALRKIPYDAVRDFTPIAMVGGTANLLVTGPALPIADLKTFVEHARKSGGKLVYASGGIGTLNHLLWEQFRAAAGFEAVTAHYRGIGPAFKDLLSRQVHTMTPGLAAAMPYVRTRRVQPVAVTGLQRHPLLPDVPTFEEAGFKGFDAVQWYGIVGPAKLPAPITARLNAEITRALALPAFRARLENEAIDPMPMTPEQFGAYIRADIARWTRLARERGITLDN